MGAAPLLCGGKALNAVEPVRAEKLSTGAADLCYSGDNPGKTPPYSIFLEKYGGKPSRREGELGKWHRAGRKSAPGSVKRASSDAALAVQEFPHLGANTSSVARAVASRYHVQQLLGKGKYSQVLQVQCRTSGLQYALKAVQKREEGNSYKLEIEVLSRCQHPGIIRLHHVLHTRDRAYLFLDLAAGGDLFDRISALGHFGENRAREILRMIVDGLSYLHGVGVTHRDVKLENLLCKNRREDSPILITDFGLAHTRSVGDGQKDWDGKRLRVEAYMSTTCGTAEYMSPEMLEGEEYGAKVDMWAVGVVAYVALSGEMPFEAAPERGGRARMYRDIKMASYSFSAEVCTCQHFAHWWGSVLYTGPCVMQTDQLILLAVQFQFPCAKSCTSVISLPA